MLKDRRTWLYLIIGSSLIFILILIFRTQNYDDNFLPTIPSPMRSIKDVINNYQDNKQPDNLTTVHHIITTQKIKDIDDITTTAVKRIQPPVAIEAIESLPLPTTQRPLYVGMRMGERVIKRMKEDISNVMIEYSFQSGGELKDYTPETGGQPIKALVITTWRSGSTFLGDILNSHPATYYHYEPLLHFEIRQARSGHLADEGLRVLNNLMSCNYTKLNSYLQYGKTHPWLFGHNDRLWQYCDNGKAPFCYQPEFLNRFCSLFPVQSIKTVRLRLYLTQKFMQDKNNKVKVLLLIRDPRGTIESRKHRDWCPGNPDCEDPAKLCGDLVSDYFAFKQLSLQFPGKYKVFRYEDFSMKPYENAAEVIQFFGLNMHNNVKSFLDTHTKSNQGGVSSTFRDTKTAPFKWREKLTREEVETIQGKCAQAMQLWGYRPLEKDQDLLDLDPVIDLEKFSP